MKDDLAPLSAYQSSLTDHHQQQEEERNARSSFWSEILAGVRKAKKPIMRVRMVGSPETRAFVSDRPDLHSNPSPIPSTASQLHFVPSSNSVPLIDQSSLTIKIRDLTQQTLQTTSPQVEKLELGRTDSGSELSNIQQTLNQFAGLSEMLLQTLLKLDGFEIEVEWTEARAARKDGVRAVQALLGSSLSCLSHIWVLFIFLNSFF